MRFVKSTKYPNLFFESKTSFWYFRKYSGLKKLTFQKKLTIKDKVNEASAYKEGINLFNEWLNIDESNAGIAATFRYQAEKYIEERSRDFEARVISRSTWESSVLCTRNHLLKQFGDLKVSQVTTEKWNEYWKAHHSDVFRTYAMQLKSGVMNEDDVRVKLFRFMNTRKALIQIMNRAKSKGLIREVPKFINPDPKSTRRVYLSEERAMKIIKYCPPTAKMIALMVYVLGMRPGEVCLLEKDQFHYYGDKVLIRLRESQSKTRRAREIPIPLHLAEMLKQWMKDHPGRCLFASRSSSNKPSVNYMPGWRKACAAANEVGVDMYCLRHSMLTDRANAGVNILTLARYTDTSVAMLEKVYYKSRLDALEQIASFAPSLGSEAVMSNPKKVKRK